MYLSREEKQYWLAYRSEETIKWPLIKTLINSAGSLERAWGDSKLLNNLRLRSSIRSKLNNIYRRVNSDKLLIKVERSEVKLAAIVEDNYPNCLREIDDPPFLLFYRGNLIKSKEKVLASVGTRKASNYGLGITKKLIEPLAKGGVVVISGLAYGIDQASHKACLNQSGKTIAVLGGGIDDDVIYPASNRGLAKKIIESGGGLVSEYLPWKRPEKRYFVARNRIISGLSEAVFVAEAGDKSGSLITAEFGLDQGKDVFALPGDINRENSFGTNNLIKDGAHPVISKNILIEYFELENIDYKNLVDLNKNELSIYELIKKGSISIEQILKETDLDASRLSVILSNMEIKGLIERVGNSKYQKK